MLEDVTVKLNTFGAKYIHAFEVWDKTARVDLTQAYQSGKWKGLVDGVPSAIEREGWSDTFVRFAVNLHGAPPPRGREFGDYRAKIRDETIVEVAFYTDNNDSYDGKKLEQAPLLFTQAHLIRRLHPGESISLSIGFNNGGEQTVDGVDKNDSNRNAAWAFKYSYPLSSQSGINVAYIRSRTHEATGINSESLALAAVYAW